MSSEESIEVYDAHRIPADVFLTTSPLVAFSGLNTGTNEAHKMVWETFSINRRPDRIPLKFLLLPLQPTFPPMKQKRLSYEWHIPKGILKSNWIKKYAKEIPALLVLFWDLEWTSNEWETEKNTIASHVQAIKLSLTGRNTRIALVLIQKESGTLSEISSSNASEKASLLCSSCDIPPQHLFVLPRADPHLLGYTIRLENAFSEMAGGFYLGESKRVKQHRDLLNKTNHMLLFIRHQFKIAFYHQMRNDTNTAVKHYTQCYHHLLEHRVTDTNLHEIRIVASIVNYKICKLNFSLNLPRDAIDQFRKHIEVFRQRTGPKELIFEHYAWLSMQYKVFGELFENAVKEGLPAVQTQHPGFYFQQAAHYAVLRRDITYQICNVGEEYNEVSETILKGWNELEFYGQRPWRPGRHLLEPPEAELENEAIKGLCYYERNKVNHSELIIPMFSSAITQFKKYRCPRIKRFLMTQMAKEYYLINEPNRALTLLNHVMWDYRSERWWPLLSSCSQLALACAHQLAFVQHYFALCLEVLGPKVHNSEEEKASAFRNFQKVISFEIPEPPKISNGNAIQINDWSVSLNKIGTMVLNMNDILSCFEVKAGFERKSCPVNEATTIKLKIKSYLPENLRVKSVCIQTNSEGMSRLTKDNLELSITSVTEVNLDFKPSLADVENKIKITNITLNLISDGTRSIILHWKGVGNEGFSSYSVINPAIKEFKQKTGNFGDCMDVGFPELSIEPKTPKMEVETYYDSDALVWEWLPVTLTLKNHEQSTADDVLIAVKLDGKSEQPFEKTTHISLLSEIDSKLGLSSLNNLSIGNLAARSSKELTVYIKSLTVATRNFRVSVSYKCQSENGKKDVFIPSKLFKVFQLSSKIPFQITIETESLEFIRMSSFNRGEKFALVPKIKCFSHVPITFVNSGISPSDSLQLCEENAENQGNFAQNSGESASKIAGLEINDGEEATDCFVGALSKSACGPTASLGQYLMYWKRSDVDVPVVSVSIALPVVTIDSSYLWVDATMPSEFTVRTPLSITYKLINISQNVLDLALTMHASDAFMFSGPKETHLRILPDWNEVISFTLYPLLSGKVQVPKLKVSVENIEGANEKVSELLSRILPSHIFVFPQKKGE